MTCLRVSLSVPILALSMVCASQDLTSGGPDSIIAGPFGEPRMVMSEGGQWNYPIKVFANAELDAFVPDITSPGWVQWHAQEFRETGKYYTYLYLYRPNTHATGRELIFVNTRSKTVTISRPLMKPFTVEISKAPSEVANSIAKITSLVAEETDRFRGQTIQSVIEQDEAVEAQIACDNPSGCPVQEYPRTTPKLVPGAVPGVNCEVGTDKSCCCADNLTRSEISSTLSIPVITKSGLYIVGGRVSAPVPLNRVEAEYTGEAQRAKIQGVALLSVIVDVLGDPQDAQIVRGLGMGLNEKALEAVGKYKFRPAMLDGKTPVPVMITVEVNFRLY